jgi:peptidoglycan/xylan/chitin deacetylase (PgdA/CDA1 family)
VSDLLLLCYHAVSEHWPPDLAVKPAALEEHVSWLARRGYRGVTLTDAVSGRIDSRAVAITFDDAYRSVFDLARPILADAGLTASVFALSAFAGTDEPMSWTGVERWLETEHRDELVSMSWDELRQLGDVGWEVGSHTRTHPRLTELDDAALDAELRGSREEIEAQLGRPCRSLAYPYGVYDDRVVEAARLAGYRAAAGTLPGRLRPPSSSLDWPRIVVNRSDSLGRFRAKTSRLVRIAKSSPAWDGVSAARRGARRLRARVRS